MGSRYPMQRGNFDGKTLSALQTAGWKSKTNNSSTTESELWRNAGPTAFQLQKAVLKSDKMRCTYLVINCFSLRTFWTPLVHLWLLILGALEKHILTYLVAFWCLRDCQTYRRHDRDTVCSDTTQSTQRALQLCPADRRLSVLKVFQLIFVALLRL